MEFSRIWDASVLIIAIGCVLVLISISMVLGMVLLDPAFETMLTIYNLALYPIFFLLYIFAGNRAVGSYALDPARAGVVSSFSYVVISLFHNVLGIGLLAIGLSNFTDTSEFADAMAIGDARGFGFLIGIGLVCMVATIVIGAVINFVIGAIGGLIGQNLSSKDKPKKGNTVSKS